MTTHPTAPTAIARTWQNPSKSSPGATPHVTQLASDGKLICSCNGWRNKRDGKPRHCTHTKDVVRDLRGTFEVAPGGEFAYLVIGGLRYGGGGRLTPVFAPTAPLHQAAPVAAVAPPVTGTAPDPMLASAMIDRVEGAAFDARYSGPGRWTGEWLMEEKIDGWRLAAVVAAGTVRAFTRTGKSYDLPLPIVAQLRRFPDGIYDGELVDATTGKSWGVASDGPKVFVIFDLATPALRGEWYSVRRARLMDVLRTLPAGQTAISTVESVPPSWAGVQAILARGGEGAVLKRGRSTYRPGYRSAEWVKVVPLLHATLTITGFKAGKFGPHTSLVMQDAAGDVAKVLTLDTAQRRAIAANPTSFIGRRVVINYRERTPDRAYRHGMFDHFAGSGE